MESCIGNPGSGRDRFGGIVCRNGIESEKLHALIKDTSAVYNVSPGRAT
ncbi:MAG: hypothetical protein PUI49_05495 [Prevotellaceae bacterium]|nr:hypothetical protein [Prevotellaceae bacterium]MDY5209992.1 hypothetical protein [Prevotella sp.]